MRLVLPKGPYRVYVSLISPEDGNRSNSPNGECSSYLEFRIINKALKPSDSELWNLYLYRMIVIYCNSSAAVVMVKCQCYVLEDSSKVFTNVYFHRTQLNSFSLSLFSFHFTTCFGLCRGHLQVWFLSDNTILKETTTIQWIRRFCCTLCAFWY
jgi:hypothetical protein